MIKNSLLNSDMLRLKFSEELSKMFLAEVPIYGNLLNLVHDINQTESVRIHRERHGAIRLGLPSELQFIKRLFAVYGMYPVAYYNLSTAGIPVHSTAFRPITQESLTFCPFRVFTSLLKLDFINDLTILNKVKTNLQERNFIPQGIENLILKFEQHKRLNDSDSEKLIELSLKIFCFNPHSISEYTEYQRFKNLHPIIADIACFHNPHINHLTPRVLDIDLAQSQMIHYGMNPKAVIEGPPKRNVPILLRQTSFKALAETVYFKCGTHNTHTARFGEIEQRGFALSAKGRMLYDRLLNQVNQIVASSGNTDNTEYYYQTLNEIFNEFPDNIDILLEQDLLSLSPISNQPITYEDFLPISAAGIFTSNLGHKAITQDNHTDFSDFCTALGDVPLNPNNESE